jgi:hypothetical protein
MGYCEQSSVPEIEPVSLEYLRKRLRLPDSYTGEDDVLGSLITGARLDAERLSGLMLAQRTFTQVMDSFPFYTDTIQSQLAYPPSYYSLPRYSTTLWNYSQMIKLARAPLISVDKLTYVGSDGNTAMLVAATDFIVDPETKLARIFPMPGGHWPPCLYTPNAVKIEFTAGYDADPTTVTTFGLPSPPPAPPNQQESYDIVTGIPQDFVDAITALAVFRFQNWGTIGVPEQFERAFQSLGVMDFAPSRG